jgi:hypothetical protein
MLQLKKGLGGDYGRVKGKAQIKDPVSKCSILFEIKEGENFSHRNIRNISRIKI